MTDGDGSAGEENDDELAISFENAEDYEHVPVNGVFGGLQSRDDFKFNFYIEHYASPEEEVYRLDEHGSANELISDEYSADVVRTVQFGAQMTQGNTIRIAIFMLGEALGATSEQIWDAISEQDIVPEEADGENVGDDQQ